MKKFDHPFRRLAAVGLFLLLSAAIAYTAGKEGLASGSPKKRSDAILQQVVAADMDARQLRAKAQEVALHDPMQAVGFFLQVMALDLEKIPLSGKHSLLIAEASRRQPSFAAPRIWLVGDHIRNQRFAEAIDGADAVMRVNTDFLRLLVPALLPLLDDDKGRPLLETKLSQYPNWRTYFLAEAAKQGGHQAEIEKILMQPASQQNLANAAVERSVYLQKLVAEGDFERAYRLWRNFTPKSARAGISDGDFTEQTPLRPFAWTYLAEEYSYAERAPAGDDGKPLVRAHHGGDTRSILLSQLVALRPGPHQLRFTMRDGGLARPDHLAWHLKCVDANTALATLPLATLATDWQTIIMRTDIPASGCALQYLQLEADLNDGKETEVEIRRVEAG